MFAANDNRPGARMSALPFGVPPRGMSRTESAAYMGVSPSLFDAMVKDGRAPQPKLVNSRTIWDRHRLDAAFEELQERQPEELGQPVNPWDTAYFGGTRESQKAGRVRRG
jgi:hypothetical protein